MTANVGYAALQVFPSMKGFEGRVNREVGPALSRSGTSGGERFGTGFATKASHSIHEKFRETAKFIVGPLIGAFAVEKIGEFIGDSIRGAVEDQGAANRAKLIFGDLSETVGKFSERAATSYGLADNQARSAAAGFGILFKQTDLSAKAGARASIQMVKLGADLAAFAHTDPEQAFTALQRGLQGSTRGLKPFGILIDSTMQKAEALRLGILKPVKDQAKIHANQIAVLRDQAAYNDAVAKNGKGSLEAQSAQAKLGSAQETLRKSVEGTVPPLTAQQKILANQSLILKQTTTQQGQFGRSSGDLREQQQKLAASIDNAKDRIGKGLLPIVGDLVGFINDKGVPILEHFSRWFEKDGTRKIGDFVGAAKPLAHSLLPAIGTGFKDIGGFLRDAAPAAKRMIDAFNGLPSWAQKAIVLGAGAGYLAKKTGILAGANALTGGRGVVGTVLGKANPIPVFVVNEGFGGGGGGGEKGILGRAKGLAEKAGPGTALGAGLGVAGLTAVGAVTIYGGIKAFQMEAQGGKVKVSGQTAAQNLRFNQQRIIDQYGGPDPFAINRRLRNRSPATDIANDLDTIRGNLGKASQGFDLLHDKGIQTFTTLEPKTKRYGDFLSHIPKRVTTQVDIDTEHAKRQVDAIRAYAGRHISAELSIELPSRQPTKAALDGVHR